MEPLDLKGRPPRGPREKLDGLTMLPRTIDKLRASLPGGNLNGYRIAGMSARLLAGLGVEEDAIRAAVAAAPDDDAVAAWLRERADTTQYAVLSEQLERRGLADVADMKLFRATYPWVEGTPLDNLFDILEEDDRRTYAGRS